MIYIRAHTIIFLFLRNTYAIAGRKKKYAGYSDGGGAFIFSSATAVFPAMFKLIYNSNNDQKVPQSHDHTRTTMGAVAAVRIPHANRTARGIVRLLPPIGHCFIPWYIRIIRTRVRACIYAGRIFARANRHLPKNKKNNICYSPRYITIIIYRYRSALRYRGYEGHEYFISFSPALSLEGVLF